MEIDQDYLPTGTAIGPRTSHEHSLRFLVLVGQNTGLAPLSVSMHQCMGS